MGFAHRLQRGPALAAGADILALVLADRAGRGGGIDEGELGAAGDADESGHGYSAAIGTQASGPWASLSWRRQAAR